MVVVRFYHKHFIIIRLAYMYNVLVHGMLNLSSWQSTQRRTILSHTRTHQHYQWASVSLKSESTMANDALLVRKVVSVTFYAAKWKRYSSFIFKMIKCFCFSPFCFVYFSCVTFNTWFHHEFFLNDGNHHRHHYHKWFQSIIANKHIARRVVAKWRVKYWQFNKIDAACGSHDV